MLIHTENREGFEIQFHALNEHLALDQLFEAEDVPELAEKIESGELVYFCANVRAYKNGIELSSEYLGGCLYADEKDFINNDCYYGDMVAAAIENARAAIKALTEDK